MSSGSRRMPNLAVANAGIAAFAAVLLLSASSGVLAQAGLNIPGASAPPPVVNVTPAAAAPAPAAAAPAPVEMPASQMPMNTETQAVQPQIPPAPAPARAAMPRQVDPLAPVQAVRPAFVPNRQVDQQLEKSTNEATQRLNQVSPEGLASADPSAISGELDQFAVRQRKIKELELLNKQAGEVQKLYKTLFGDDAKIGQPLPGTASAARQAPQITEEEVRKRVEQARADALREAEESKVQKERDELALGPRPVVAQIIGTAKKRQAVVMLPCDRGNVTVSVGNRLSQGDDPMRVVAISEQGVEVSQKGNRFLLGFGNVSSKCTPVGNLGPRPTQASAAPSGAYPVPVMGGPLQISGGTRMR